MSKRNALFLLHGFENTAKGQKPLLVVKGSNYHFVGKTAGAAVSICAAHFGFHANEGCVVFSSTSADGGIGSKGK